MNLTFADLDKGQFFGAHTDTGYNYCIFMKMNSSQAVVVFDMLFGETVGRLLEFDPGQRLRETYDVTMVDGQSSHPEDFTFPRRAQNEKVQDGTS